MTIFRPIQSPVLSSPPPVACAVLSVIHVPCRPKRFLGLMERQCQPPTCTSPTYLKIKFTWTPVCVLALSPDPQCVYPLIERLEESSLLSWLPNLFLKVSNFAAPPILAGMGGSIPSSWPDRVHHYAVLEYHECYANEGLWEIHRRMNAGKHSYLGTGWTRWLIIITLLLLTLLGINPLASIAVLLPPMS
jgi:hypothetical protein